MGRTTRRRHYAINKLPPKVKETVDEMIKAGFTYKEIAEYIKSSGKNISISTVQRYALNLKAITNKAESYDPVDFAEILVLLLCGLLLEKISHLSSEQMQDLSVDELIKSATDLTKVVAYKNKYLIDDKKPSE